jgi:E3 ubiquitin-protein ligase RNF115/126
MSRIVFINSMQNQHLGNPPAAKKSLEKLKHFNMEKKYCKKDEKDPSKIEYPTCSICLMDINDGQKTILLPCGHMFHDECITKWLNIHNTCPLCRFELPTDDPEYERKRNERNTQRNENINRNPNVTTADLNNPGNLNEHNNRGNGNNINIQGESAFN